MQALKELVEARTVVRESVDAGGLQEEDLDVVGAFQCPDPGNGQIAVDRPPLRGG